MGYDERETGGAQGGDSAMEGRREVTPGLLYPAYSNTSDLKQVDFTSKWLFLAWFSVPKDQRVVSAKCN
jgi:hypothetical protein